MAARAADNPVSVAIETSGRIGSAAIGRGDQLLEAVTLAQARRHNVELTAAIDALTKRHGVSRTELAEVYVSIGPGSFTGLRVAAATAKMLALALGAKIAAVPTLEVTACNVPGPVEGGRKGHGCPHLAAALNLKRAAAYTGLFSWRDGRWQAMREPGLRTTAELLAEAPRPLALLGPEDFTAAARGAEAVTVLDEELLTARAAVVWRLGRELAAAGHCTEAAELTPLYVRPPEAVELWKQRNPMPAATS